jgi:uncharacterized membrane protein
MPAHWRSVNWHRCRAHAETRARHEVALARKWRGAKPSLVQSGDTIMTTTTPSATKAISPGFVLGSIGFATLGTFVFMAAASLISGGARISYEDTQWAMAIHIGTVIPALFLGGPVLMMKKGTKLHKLLGRIWAALMMTTAISSFWLQGITGTISPIHIFSVITIVSIPWAIYSVRKGNLIAHQRAMTGPYIGLLIAGLFSFMPGRLMGNLAFAMF